jgi:acyl carrier protein
MRYEIMEIQIMEKLLEILSELHSDVDFENTEDLVDDGILDSLDIVTLVTEIDAEFGVTIPAEEIIPENFNSARALMELITRLDEE